jgi:hypothetical protein
MGVLATIAGGAIAQSTTPFAITSATCPRIADPKLADSRIDIGVAMAPASGFANVQLTLHRGGAQLGTIWSGRVDCAMTTFAYSWDGKLVIAPATVRKWIDPGAYEVRIDAVKEGTNETASQTLPLNVVRLGITEILALPNGPDTEFQMVYFKRGTQPGTFFYATPAIHEYLNIAGTGEVSDLDLNDGRPRPPVPVHTATASPLIEGTTYEDDAHNYPVCYTELTAPRFEVRFGATGTSAAGTAIGAKYPVGGVLLRCRADSTLGPWTTTTQTIAPSTGVVFTGPVLPNGFRCHDFAITWSFDSSRDGGLTWSSVPGRITTSHRLYTTVGIPRFGGTGATQYAGPWVEVADYARQWAAALSIDTATPARLTEAVIKGFGGQIGTITGALEGVRYDAGPLGGDGGASHYFTGTNTIQLSRWLDLHQNGIFVNCSDCASASSAMLGMLGVSNVKMNRLGSMTLRAIRGIGAPAYTLDLWGGGGHGFSYHHVVTRSEGQSICDACLWVDEDGNAMQLPGTPGYNHDRPWSGTSGAYMNLLATGPITFQLETLPTLQ